MAHYPGYTVLRTEDCPEQHGTLTLLTHDVSGAAVLLVENEDVNKALRLVIELGRLAKKPEVKTEAEKVEQAEAPAVAAEEAMFTEDVFEDEDVEAVAEAEETAEAKSEDKAE